MLVFIQIKSINRNYQFQEGKVSTSHNTMKKEELPHEDSQSDLNSSSSSYSEIFPRQDNLVQLRKDNPIIIRSIPINNKKTSLQTKPNSNQYKNQSITMISSTHANTNLSHSNISAEVYKNPHPNQNLSISTKSIKIQQKQPEDQTTLNQQLVKSTYEKYQQKENVDVQPTISSKKEEQTSRQEFDNVALDLSMSSMSSQRPQVLCPKEPFKMYLESSPERNEVKKDEQQVKQYLQAIRDMRRSEQRIQSPIRSQSMNFQTLIKKNHELQLRIRQLQDLIKNQSESKIIERKANEVYTQFYHTLSKMITKFISNNQNQFFSVSNQSMEPLNESLNMEKILQTVQKLIDNFSIKPISLKNQHSNKQAQTQYPNDFKKQHENNNQYTQRIQQLSALLQAVEQKNVSLRNQLLQSTQNNINNIFNTQISASCCLQNQVTKINSEMKFLKQKINLLLLKENPPIFNPQPLPPQIIYLSQPVPSPFSERKQNNIVKIYTTKSKIRQSQEDSDCIQESEKRKRQHSLSRRKKKSQKKQRSVSSSSLSSKSTKKREQLSMKQIKNLKEAYNQTKKELNSLMQMFSFVSSSQNEMKGYFTQIKDQIIRSLNQKLRQKEEDHSRKQEQKLKELQHQLKVLQQSTTNNELTLKMKHNQDFYIRQIQLINNGRQQDRQVIKCLNQKIVDLINEISVPERVNQQNKNQKSGPINDDQIPLSQISVSVDYLKQIERLRSQQQKQTTEMEALVKENNFLKQEILQLKNIQQRCWGHKSINNSSSSSEQGQESIINELKGFTEMSLGSPLMINTGQNYHPTEKKSNKSFRPSKQVTFNHSLARNFVQSTNTIESQKIVHINSQRNIQTNFKVILHSKQTHIKHLQQQLINLEQTIQFMKSQIQSKEQVIQELQLYVSNLQSKSINSIPLSSPGVNPNQKNLYLDLQPDQIKHRYENYVKNLKILLKQTKNQNKILKEQLHTFEVQTDPLSQSNFNLKNSVSYSERTTKNFPNSSSPTHINSRGQGQRMIRKRVQTSQRYEMERQQQRINSLACDIEL